MTVLNIYKAQPIGGVPAESVEIRISTDMPSSTATFPDRIREAERIFEKEAETLCDALFKSLPGGTVDGLLVAMMKRKASMFVVSLVDPVTSGKI